MSERMHHLFRIVHKRRFQIYMGQIEMAATGNSIVFLNSGYRVDEGDRSNPPFGRDHLAWPSNFCVVLYSEFAIGVDHNSGRCVLYAEGSPSSDVGP